MILELPPGLTLRYMIGVRLAPMIGLGLVLFFGLLAMVQKFGLPDAICLVGPITLALLFIPLWRLMGRSVVELTEAGITIRDWRGKQQDIQWSEIISVKGDTLMGNLVLHSFDKNKKIQISDQRENFVTVPYLLVHYCPSLWEIQESLVLKKHPVLWGFVILAGGFAFWMFSQGLYFSSIPSLLGGLIFLLISLYFAWRASEKLVISKNGIAFQRWFNEQEFSFTSIVYVGLHPSHQIGAIFHIPTITLENKKTIDLHGFGNSFSLFCLLFCKWLDTRGEGTTVQWGYFVDHA